MNRSLGRLRFDHAHVATHDERFEQGRAARKKLPRSAIAHYEPGAARDPLGVLDRQHESRLPDLVPLRIARMLQDSFAFYRGTAAIQAADLAGEATTGAGVVICGDAHISNFGLFASPERTMVFDLNDFDEAAFGPWEWDVKRMLTSVVIAARSRGASAGEIRHVATLAAEAYRDGLRDSLALDVPERFFRPADVSRARQFGKTTQKLVKATVKASEKRTSNRVTVRITETATDGSLHLIENPPRLTHVGPEIEKRVSELIDLYRSTLPSSVSLLLAQYTVTDVGRRVVGVGSVGTRCFIVVLTGPRGEPLILQVKEAVASVVHEFGRQPVNPADGIHLETFLANHGYRVIANQRILQAASDPFLGYVSLEGFAFYVRQFRDRNVSFEVSDMADQSFLDYATACSSILARAHSRSPNGAFISGYIGKGAAFSDAMVAWSHAYADQSLADYDALIAAVTAGRYEAAELS